MFSPDVPVIFNLQIPHFLRDIPVCNSSCQFLQRRALVNFYTSTNGPNWIKRKGWNTTDFYCDWEGILCYNRTLHVIALKLDTNSGMQGYVGDTLGQLPFLLGFNLGGNEIKGDISQLLGTFKEFLILVDFAFNKLHGTMPSNISKTWKKLRKLQLSGNANIRGVLSDDICSLQDMQVLSIGETGITGSIPRCISKLSKLYFLDLETLSLTGNLTYIKGLSNLKWIHLMSNRITGEIPQDFGNWFPELIQLILQGNKLNGTIPSSIGNLRNLSLLQLSGNKDLTGLLPLSLSNLTKLTILDISYTSINGFETGLILNAPYLNSFVAKGNKKFSVSIYQLIEVLERSKKSLIQLNVRGCNIYGDFQTSCNVTKLKYGIFRFSKLAFLDISDNERLYGTIPDPIGSASLLMFFNASFTNLSSALPVNYLIKFKILQEIDVRGNPHMRGDIDRYFINIDYTTMSKERKSDKFTCPSLSFRHNNGIILTDSSYYDRKQCMCIPGYYGLGGYCKKCMTGAICEHSATRAFTTFASYMLTNMTLQKGFWPYPHHKNVRKFLSCQWTLPGRETCNPSGSVHCFLKRVDSQFVTVCEGKICKTGSTGRLCGQCERGFFKSGEHCHPCPQPTEAKALAVIITVAIFMIILIGVSLFLFMHHRRVFATIFAILQAVSTFILAVMGIIPSWLAQINIIIFLITVAGFGKSCKVLMKIIVFYVQIVDSLITSAHIWPVAFYDFADYLSSAVNLRFAVFACKQPRLLNPLGQLILLMALPVSFIIILAAFPLMPIFRRRWPNIKYKCAHLSIMFLNLAYFPLVKATASVLIPCRQVDDQSFMAKFPWVDCPSTQYHLAKSFAFISLVLYVIGIPVLFFGLLVWKRNDVMEGDQTTQDWLGSLYTPYKMKHRLIMEVLLMMRRTALAFLSAFFVDDTSLQLGLISVVFLICLTYESQAKPFLPTNHSKSCDGTPRGCTCVGLENLLELTMLITLFVSFMAVKSSILDRHVSMPLIWVVGVGNCMFGLVLTISFISRLLKRTPGVEIHEDGEPLVEHGE